MGTTWDLEISVRHLGMAFGTWHMDTQDFTSKCESSSVSSSLNDYLGHGGSRVGPSHGNTRDNQRNKKLVKLCKWNGKFIPLDTYVWYLGFCRAQAPITPNFPSGTSREIVWGLC